MTRATVAPALVLVAATLTLFTGCGTDDAPSQTAAAPQSSTPQATGPRPPCTRAAVTTAAAALAPDSPTSLMRLRCSGRYALARIAQGETRRDVLLRADPGRWNVIANDFANAETACPASADPAARRALSRLCDPPRDQPELRRCTAVAFLSALRQDVDDLKFGLGKVRCAERHALTTFAIDDCQPEQRGGTGCTREKVAAWRLGKDRWHLITYVQSEADICSELTGRHPPFPARLCPG